MSKQTTAPYGSWKSPITADLVVSAGVGLGQFRLDGDDVYWLEMRPTEGGRYVLVRRTSDGRVADVTPPPHNVRTRVHEYGGGAFAVTNGVVYFVNYADQRIYSQVPGEEPKPLTPEAAMRYADFVVDERRGRLICVREDHTPTDREPINTVASVPLSGGSAGVVLTSGADFYAFPRLSPDGSRLCWISWSHPNMPWDGTDLWEGVFAEDGSVEGKIPVAGGPSESIFQPTWSPDGVLHFVSDRTGWWNLYCWRDRRVEPVYPMEAEFGRPVWNLGISSFAFVSSDEIICTYNVKGTWRLGLLDVWNGKLEEIETPYTEMRDPQVAGGAVYFVAGSPAEPSALVRLDLTTRRIEVIRRSQDVAVDPGYLSIPETVEFPTEGGKTAYGFFYRPRNRDYAAPAGERPPLVVRSHGGPTSSTSTTLRLELQYWTSRGIGVLDVNYGGSTGYGRAYRERLRGNWGIVDVDDCVNGAQYLVQRGDVDGKRLAISGGSAGGYTTLCALAFRDVFGAGASHYGVSDLEALARDTHKFESRYLDSMIGPYPERRDLYLERSPISHPEKLSCPTIFFQGLEDAIVPPSQTETMVEALRKKGVPVAALYFEGEQHGFRRAENIKRSLEAELYFYSRVFGFGLGEAVEPVEIENMA